MIWDPPGAVIRPRRPSLAAACERGSRIDVGLVNRIKLTGSLWSRQLVNVVKGSHQMLHLITEGLDNIVDGFAPPLQFLLRRTSFMILTEGVYIVVDPMRKGWKEERNCKGSFNETSVRYQAHVRGRRSVKGYHITIVLASLRYKLAGRTHERDDCIICFCYKQLPHGDCS